MNKRQLGFYNDLKIRADNIGWKVLSDKYVNTMEHMLFECTQGHQQLKRPTDFKTGYGCAICSREAKSGEKEFLSLLVAEGYQIVGKYIGARTLVALICPQNHNWTVLPSTFKNAGRRCPLCSEHSIVNAKNQFLKLLLDEGYQAINEYQHSKTKLNVICPQGHVIEIIPDRFKHQGTRCTICNGRIYDKDGVEFLELLQLEGYTTKDSYLNCSTKMLILCPNNHEWLVKPHAFKNQGSRCPDCPNKKFIESRKNLIGLLNTDGYVLLEEYTNFKSHVSVKCPVGHIFKTTPNRFTRGKRCRKCAGLCPEEAKKSLIKLATEEGYTLCGEYINDSTHILMKCSNSHEWNAAPSHFKQGTRCPHCVRTLSKGEIAVKKILDKLHIKYIMQKKFSFLPTRKYDFYFVYNNIHHVIEFDGNQHFNYVPLFHNNDINVFYQRQHNDILKTYNAMLADINVIRISMKEIKFIEQHITCALQSNWKLYVSNRELYKYITKPLGLT